MADQEIAKHTKNVIHLLGDKEHGWRNRLAEITQEILIIVFAVSLSIWLHGLFEHHQEQAQVKTFLLGLRDDLRNDVATIKQITDADHGFDANYQYLANLKADQAPEQKKFDAAYAMLDSNFFFKPMNSRFDGFRSSGHLTNIDDTDLLNQILALYGNSYPAIAVSQNGWISGQDKLRNYLDAGLTGDDGIAERYALIVTPKCKRLLRTAVTYPQLYERYKDYADQANAIIATISQLYPQAHAG